MDNGYYLYAIGRIKTDYCIGNIGETMEQGHALTFIENEQLCAICSLVPLTDFGPEPLARNLRNIDWLEKAARNHDRIIRRISAAMTVVPVRFGTVFFTSDNVLNFLSQNEERLNTLLASLDGAWEMVVTLEFDDDKLVKTLGSSDEEARSLMARIASSGEGAAYLFQKKLESLEKVLLDSYAQEQIETFTTAVRTLSSKVTSKQIARHPHLKSSRYASIACLVPQGDLESFERRIDSLSALTKTTGLTVRTTGPWPPYSFASLQEVALRGN